jgi:hypothetical protein
MVSPKDMVSPPVQTQSLNTELINGNISNVISLIENGAEWIDIGPMSSDMFTFPEDPILRAAMMLTILMLEIPMKMDDESGFWVWYFNFRRAVPPSFFEGTPISIPCGIHSIAICDTCDTFMFSVISKTGYRNEFILDAETARNLVAKLITHSNRYGCFENHMEDDGMDSDEDYD